MGIGELVVALVWLGRGCTGMAMMTVSDAVVDLGAGKLATGIGVEMLGEAWGGEAVAPVRSSGGHGAWRRRGWWAVISVEEGGASGRVASRGWSHLTGVGARGG